MTSLLCLLACASLALTGGCCPPKAATSPTPASTMPAASADRAFDSLADRFFDRYFELAPVEATLAGDHRHDGRWPDLSTAGDAAYSAFLDEMSGELAKIPRDKLGEQDRIDASILETQLAYGRFALTELRAPETDPVLYTDLIGEGLDPLVNRTFADLPARMASVRDRLDGIPALVAAAKARLGRPAKIKTDTAIEQNAGLIALVETELPGQLAGLPPPLRAEVEAAAKRAAASLHELQAFFQAQLLPRSDGSFRLGRERFAKKLALVLDDPQLDIDALARDARALIAQTQAEMVDTAKQVWAEDKLGPLPPLDTEIARKAFVKQVLDHLAEDHPTNATILADAKRWLDQETAFVRTQDLVRVPDEPIKVIEMPEYRRGVAIAYCDSSGPLETHPETFFAISPTPKDWPAARAESFYREYNQSMLADLSVHEAMPGHYLQLMHNNQFHSKLRAVFQSGAFVEGWAVYAEWLMADKGFGGPKVKLERQKMALRMATNTVLDHDVHAGTMDEQAALALMTGEALQEEGEAVGKWKRARLTSAQLTTYFYGFTEFAKLRKAAVARPEFNERAYHDRLLSWGSPAMRYVRELMTKP